MKVHRFHKWFALQITTGLFYFTELTLDTADRVHQQYNKVENNAALHRFLEVSPELWQHVRVSSSCHWCTRPLQSWCQWPLERPHSPPRVDRSAWQFPVRESSSDQITYRLMIHRKHAQMKTSKHSKSFWIMSGKILWWEEDLALLDIQYLEQQVVFEDALDRL